MVKQLTNLPIELVTNILKYLDLKDVKNLSRCSRAYHSKIQDFLFRCVKLSWDQIDKFLIEMDSKMKYIEKVIVFNKTQESYGEWNINLMEKFSGVPKLVSLEVRLLNSTNCLKYQNFHENNIKQLQLSTDQEGSIFSLYHVKNFTKLEQLKLQNFQIMKDLEEINVEVQENHSQFKRLYIKNCDWRWPFELNFYPNLTHLELYYDTTNPFILCERFRNFLSDKTTLIHLLELKIEIDDSKDKNLYLYPSLNLLNLVNLKKLQKLSLLNFKNLDFKKFYRLIDQLNLIFLDLKLINNDSTDFKNYKLLLSTKIETVHLELVV